MWITPVTADKTGSNLVSFFCFFCFNSKPILSSSTFRSFYAATFRLARVLTVVRRVFPFKIRQTRQSFFLNCSPGAAFPCASVRAIGVLGKLILQVTDSFLLRQNSGLQILNFLQQPLQQLRLHVRRVQRKGRKEWKKDSDRHEAREDKDGKWVKDGEQLEK